MNLPPPTLEFAPIVNVLHSVAKKICFESLSNAIEEAVTENDGCRDIEADFDDSWQKRGHRSLNGVITATRTSTFLQIQDARVIG